MTTEQNTQTFLCPNNGTDFKDLVAIKVPEKCCHCGKNIIITNSTSFVSSSLHESTCEHLGSYTQIWKDYGPKEIVATTTKSKEVRPGQRWEAGGSWFEVKSVVGCTVYGSSHQHLNDNISVNGLLTWKLVREVPEAKTVKIGQRWEKENGKHWLEITDFYNDVDPVAKCRSWQSDNDEWYVHNIHEYWTLVRDVEEEAKPMTDSKPEEPKFEVGQIWEGTENNNLTFVATHKNLIEVSGTLFNNKTNQTFNDIIYTDTLAKWWKLHPARVGQTWVSSKRPNETFQITEFDGTNLIGYTCCGDSTVPYKISLNKLSEFWTQQPKNKIEVGQIWTNDKNEVFVVFENPSDEGYVKGIYSNRNTSFKAPIGKDLLSKDWKLSPAKLGKIYRYKTTRKLYRVATTDFDQLHVVRVDLPSTNFDIYLDNFSKFFESLDTTENNQTEPVLVEKPMTTVKKSMATDVLDTFKSDAGDAGYRIAAKQISKGTKAAIITLMKAKGAKRTWIKAASEMMDTEGGLAVVSVVLGWSLKFVPGLKDDPRAVALAKEFRVEGMAHGGNLLADQAMEYFLPLIMQIKNLPEPPKVRIEVESEDTEEVEVEAQATEEADKVTAPEKAVVRV